MSSQTGAAGADQLDGGPGDDVLQGLGGADTLSGFAGVDILYGDSPFGGADGGQDLLYGGDGSDFLSGGVGADTLYGGAGDDTLVPQLGYNANPVTVNGVTTFTFGYYLDAPYADVIDGGDGNDKAYIYEGFATSAVALDLSDPTHASLLHLDGVAYDSIIGVERLYIETGSGDDTITGGIGADELYVGSGNNVVHGGVGDDTIGVAGGNSLIDGGDGSDTLIFAVAPNGVTVDLRLQGHGQATGIGQDTLIGIENLGGSSQSDSFLGDSGANVLEDHLGGADSFYGGAGDDTLSQTRFFFSQNPPAAQPNDVLYGDDGNDVITFTATSDRNFSDSALLSGGTGDDVIQETGVGAATLMGGVGNDHVTYDLGGGSASVTLGAGADTLSLMTSTGAIRTGISFAPGQASSTVLDFAAGAGGDVLDVSPLVASGAIYDSGYQYVSLGSNPFQDGHFRVEQVGTTVVVSVDADGRGASYYPLLALQNTQLSDLTPANFGGYALPTALHLVGGSGPDTLVGGPADDRIQGGAGLDTAVLAGNLADASISYGDGGAFTVSGKGGVDVLTGIEQVRFDEGLYDVGADGRLIDVQGVKLSAAFVGTTLVGQGGDDTLIGGAEADTLTGGGRSEVLDGGDGVDTATYAGFVHDYALAVQAASGTVSGGVEGGNDSLASVENLQFLDGTLTFDNGSTAAQIVRLYDSFLGRAPDAAGFNGYLNYVAAGHTFQDIAANAAASAEFHDATANLTDDQYITYVYEHSLHREPDAYGLQQYEQALHDGSLTRTSLIVQAAESPEHVALTAPVVAQGLWIPDAKVEGLELLYDAAVQRQPDPTGLKGYGDLLASGASFEQIANQMAASAEFQAAHAGQNDMQYVDSLYVAEVGRHADPYGLAAYTAELANGHTRGDILYETAMGQEHQSHVLAYYDPLLVGG